MKILTTLAASALFIVAALPPATGMADNLFWPAYSFVEASGLRHDQCADESAAFAAVADLAADLGEDDHVFAGALQDLQEQLWFCLDSLNDEGTGSTFGWEGEPRRLQWNVSRSVRTL